MAVNLTKFSANVDNIQGLSDRPNTTDGLTSAELKAKFDKAGDDIKAFINGVFIPELEQNFNQIVNDVSIELRETIATVNESMSTALTGMGLNQDTYSTATEYEIGDMVIHNYAVQKCTSPTTGEWDSSAWEIVPVVTNE